MTADQAMNLVVAELQRAEGQHPGWPTDRLRQVAIVAEEAGEALKAALDIIFAEEAMLRTHAEGYAVTLQHNRMAHLEEELQKEVVQTAAMALRWLLNRVPLYAQDRPSPPAS